jgi:NAD(P)H-nitrite reductase large subunit
MTLEEQIAQITDSLEKLPPVLKKNLDRNLCTCNEVLKMDIINAIVNGATTVGDIKKQTYATVGSGCCTQQVERLIECLCSPEKGEVTLFPNKRALKNSKGVGDK